MPAAAAAGTSLAGATSRPSISGHILLIFGDARRWRGAVMDPQPDPRELPIAELVKTLGQETSMLMRQELDLAKAEVTKKAKKAGVGIAGFGAAGIIAFVALEALTACLIAAIAVALPVWAAALIVTGAYAAVAGVLALLGRRRLAEAVPPKPEQTIESVKEDVEWVKTRMSSGSG
jgi:hypothetical protein